MSYFARFLQPEQGEGGKDEDATMTQSIYVFLTVRHFPKKKEPTDFLNGHSHTHRRQASTPEGDHVTSSICFTAVL